MTTGKIIYKVTNLIDGVHQVTFQRGTKPVEIFKQVNDLEMAIGYATIAAIQSKQDYGNKNVYLVIEPAICSIDEPTVKI